MARGVTVPNNSPLAKDNSLLGEMLEVRRLSSREATLGGPPAEGRLSVFTTRSFPAEREMCAVRVGPTAPPVTAPSARYRPRARPSHEGGIVGGEKDDALGDVVGHAEPADRVGGQGKPTRRVDIVASCSTI
jgi:hypothetical protein